MAAPARVANNSPKRQEPQANQPAKREEEEAPPSRLAWFIGWFGVPCLVFGGIFGGGVLVGAHYPDGWIAWAVTGVAGLFGG
ncbi:hypothetical protein [Nannocystis punicea]|uniref:Uncharacterized protein n=1 Tax=Nannocystis punicea TaxID=2995304 RepID=A0ABY7H0G9_9BACT|nr:hypothetical protein [Nannocystis poenicansa]WAS92744.1 hypothetical protein O0S08_41730 [Nannocystis poenicansa]